MLCGVGGVGGWPSRRGLGQDVEGVRPLLAVRLERAGRGRPGGWKLQQVPLRAAELLGAIQGGGGNCELVGGGTRRVGCHADMRVVVGLQEHGGDVTAFPFVSVEKPKQGLKILIVLMEVKIQDSH